MKPLPKLQAQRQRLTQARRAFRNGLLAALLPLIPAAIFAKAAGIKLELGWPLLATVALVGMAMMGAFTLGACFTSSPDDTREHDRGFSFGDDPH